MPFFVNSAHPFRLKSLPLVEPKIGLFANFGSPLLGNFAAIICTMVFAANFVEKVAYAETILKPVTPLVATPDPQKPETLLKKPDAKAAAKAPSSQKTTEPEKIVVALDWVPNTNHTGLYVANEKKWYAAQNIQPLFLQPAQTTATKLVGAGKAEFGVSFTNDVARARARGIPVVAIAAIIQNNTSCFAWRKNMNIKSLKDFEGKRYGGWGSPEEELTLSYLMKKQGADFKKVRIVTTGVSDFVATTPRNADFMWIYMGWDGIRAKLEGVELGTLCPKDLDPVFNTASLSLSQAKNSFKKSPNS